MPDAGDKLQQEDSPSGPACWLPRCFWWATVGSRVVEQRDLELVPQGRKVRVGVQPYNYHTGFGNPLLALWTRSPCCFGLSAVGLLQCASPSFAIA